MTEFIEETEDLYHSQSGCNTQGKNLSSHLLMSFMESPYLYQQIVSGNHGQSDSAVFLLGRAFHALLLEGEDAYNARYAWRSPINITTGKPFGSTTKKFEEWRVEQLMYGIQVLTRSEHELITAMYQNAVRNKIVSDGLKCSPTREGVLRCVYQGINCQIRIDACGMNSGIWDVKTCKSLKSFPYDARNYHYFNQLAFYRAVYKTALGTDNHSSNVHIIASEKTGLKLTGVWKLDPICLDAAQEENEAAIERLKSCMQNDTWPTGYEHIHTLHS